MYPPNFFEAFMALRHFGTKGFHEVSWKNLATVAALGAYSFGQVRELWH
jgi:hypothetical protein